MIDMRRVAKRLGMPFYTPKPDPIQQSYLTGKIDAHQPYIFDLCHLGQQAHNEDVGLELAYELSRLVFGTKKGWNETSNLEKAWYENSLWPKLLIPFSWVYQFLFNRQKRHQISNSWKPNLLTIVVGNLTVGGTGKTPIIIYLAKLLKKEGLKPGIISRGYLSKSKTYPLLLNSETPN